MAMHACDPSVVKSGGGEQGVSLGYTLRPWVNKTKNKEFKFQNMWFFWKPNLGLV